MVKVWRKREGERQRGWYCYYKLQNVTHVTSTRKCTASDPTQELTESCCSFCSLVLQSLMVQSKEDVRNRWERSALEREEKKRGGRERGRRGKRREREREGGRGRETEGGKLESTHQMIPITAPGCAHLAPYSLVCADV